MRDLFMWLSGSTGQGWCLFTILAGIGLYVWVLVFETKWGD